MTHTRPMSCAPHPGTVGPKHRPVEDGVETVAGHCTEMVRDGFARFCNKRLPCPVHGGPPAEDATYRMTPAQELDLAVEELRWVMADWLHSRQRRRLREVLRAVKAAQAGLDAS